MLAPHAVVARLIGTLIATVLAVGVAGCQGGSGGAVVVRWQLVDPSTGSKPDGCPVGTPDCCLVGNSDYCCALLQTSDPLVEKHVVVDAMHLKLVPVTPDGGSAPVECAQCRWFDCSSHEHATGFDIPPGDYLISLEAMRCGAVVGSEPPAVRRTVRRGAFTNLNAIEILLSTSTRTCGEPPDLR